MSKLADQIIGHYERHAIAWDGDRARAAWNDKPWHDRFIGSLPKGATVLDLGCGSGSPVARHMAANGLKITGVDSSPTFISLCRSRLPGHTLARRRYAVATAEAKVSGDSGLGQLFSP
jgi:ubiquinone/menaquinone biosynthesis C-methylase UbiE